nr:hypothetical protein [Tanacetum cinerariifolium]
MAKIFLGKYFPPSMVTKLRNDITNFRHEPDESLFEAWERYKLLIDRCPNHNMLPMTQIDTFYNGLTLSHRDTINAAAGAQRSESSSSITSSNPEIASLKLEMAKINKNSMKMLQTNQQVNAVTLSCETCGGPHSYNDCPATVGQIQNVYPEGRCHGQNLPPAYQAPTYQAPAYQAPAYQAPAYQALVYQAPGYQALVYQAPIPQPFEGYHYSKWNCIKGPMIPTTSSPPKVVERETEVTKDTVPPTNNGSTKDVQPPVVQVETQIPKSNPVVEPVQAPVSTPKPNPKPSILYPSRLHDQKIRDKAC